MDTLYTFWDNATHYKTESVHFWGLMNSATKEVWFLGLADLAFPWQVWRAFPGPLVFCSPGLPGLLGLGCRVSGFGGAGWRAWVQDARGVLLFTLPRPPWFE